MPTRNNMKKDARNFADMAIKLGAEHSVIFKIEDIVFDPRSILKCMFGCREWGKGHTCPSRPGSLRPWEYQKIFGRYSWGILIHAASQKVSQEISFAIERQAFVKGYYFAFSLSDCTICEECAGYRSEECKNPKKARPALQGVGIDVFKTVHKFGLPLKTLKDEQEQQNWYSAVFVE